jgi:hypothetical protein
MKLLKVVSAAVWICVAPLSSPASPAGAVAIPGAAVALPQAAPWLTGAAAGFAVTAQGAIAPVLILTGTGAAVYVLENPNALNPESANPTERWWAATVLPALRRTMMANTNPVLRAWGEHLFRKQAAYDRERGLTILRSSEELLSGAPKPLTDDERRTVEEAAGALGALVESGAVALAPEGHPAPATPEGDLEIDEVLSALSPQAEALARGWLKGVRERHIPRKARHREHLDDLHN